MLVIDDKYQKVEAYIRGRKEKIWLEKNGQRYLYKFGFSNYEIYAELIASQLAKQVDISMASYRIAKYQDTIGVLSKNFVKKGELIISSDRLKQAVQSIYEENNLEGNLKENTISNLLEAAFTYDMNLDIDQLFNELVRRWMFYGIIMESDKNDTNISFLRKKSRLKLAPDYDNSTMSRLNEDVKSLISNLGSATGVYQLTDPIKQSFKPTEDSSDYFLESFADFSKDHIEKVDHIFSSFKNLDVDQAIEKVEKLNKIEVPFEVKYFLNKTISARYQDMKGILASQKKNIQRSSVYTINK